LIGACGPACAGAGAFIASSIGASVAGGAIGNAIGQGADIALGYQSSFDVGDFGVEVAASAVFGAIPFGKGAKGVASAAARGAAGDAGQALAKRGSRSSTTKLLRGVAGSPSPGGSAPIALPWRASLKGAGKPAGGALPAVTKSAGPGGVAPIVFPNAIGVAGEAAGSAAAAGGKATGKDLLADLGAAVGQGIFTNIVAPDTGSPPPGTAGAARDALTVRQSGLRELNAGSRAVYGEYAAWRFYQAVHTLAGRALPNNPNPALPSF
jgi:hypothetical protein